MPLSVIFAGAWSKHIIDFDKHGSISEAFQSEQVEAEVLDQGSLEYVLPLISSIYKIWMEKYEGLTW